MSNHTIPTNVNLEILRRSVSQLLREPSGVLFGNGIDQRPTELEFTPDLSAGELTTLNLIFDYASTLTNFDGVNGWTTYTPQEAQDAFTQNVFAGKTLQQVDVDIDALPATVPGMRTGLHQAAAAIVALRDRTGILAKAAALIRNLVIKIKMKWI